MHRLFPAEGERVPKLRFSEFKDMGEWEERKLGEVCEIRKGIQLNKTNFDILGKYQVINGGINPSGYLHKWNTKANSITISEGGKSCGYINFTVSKFWLGGHCYTIEKLKSSILNFFLFHFLKFKQRLIMRLRVGSGLPNIQKKDINNFEIIIPPLPEQQKIASCFSSLDNLIITQEKKINTLKDHKRRLMQELFPQNE